MVEIRFWVWLATRAGIGPRTRIKLLDYFGSPRGVYFSDRKEYEYLLGKTYESLENKNLLDASAIVDKCTQSGVRIITLRDAIYPERLRNIADPPIVLYVKGNLPNMDDEAAVAIVGTRSCTPYGIKTAEKIAYDFTRAGGLVVSGLAHGVDSAGIRGALRAGGAAIGVLGCGIDVVYPATNAGLYSDVAAVGALITEFPPGARPDAKNFPIRNRIMSGISAGTLVIEAPERSGALITAMDALEQGRDVFAVPGNIDAVSCRGSNALLRDGAIPVTSARDLVEEYITRFPHRFAKDRKNSELDDSELDRIVSSEMGHTPKKRGSRKKTVDKKKTEDYIVNEGNDKGADEKKEVSADTLSETELAVIKAMDADKTRADVIIERTGFAANDVLAALTMLELNGYITKHPGQSFTSHIVVK